MKILVACEESQAVTIEMRNLGHEAYSCDLQEPSGGHPEWHIHGDALDALSGGAKQRQEFARFPKFRALYVRAFDRMIANRKEKRPGDWHNGEEVMRWWLKEEADNV